MSSPTHLGRYAVRRRIGSGGFATVWLGYDEQLDSPVAIKVLADNWTEDHHVRRRFVEEGRFLRKVDSPHVVPVYDAGELEDGRPFLVMAYADQGNLATRLAGGPLPLGQALAVIRQVGAGLSALHQRGVLHRDLKPANVLFRTIDPDPDAGETESQVRAMLGDLGLGKALDMSSRLTMIAGTPSYVSPEQAQGESLDPRADEYSLGVLAYLLLTGRPAYEHSSLGAAATPAPPPPMGDHLPEGVEEIVRRALAVDRAERWPSVAAFVTALQGAAAEHPAAYSSVPEAWVPADPDLTQPGVRPTPLRTRAVAPTAVVAEEPAPPRLRRRLAWTVAGLLVLALGAAGGYLAQQRATREIVLRDDSQNMSVAVPFAWSRHVATAGWTPPGADSDFPALAAGSSPDWQASGSTGSGVFLGLFAGDHIPARIPKHPECASALEPVSGTARGDTSRTVTYTDCAGGDVVVERVIQVTENRLLWVQVRGNSRGVVNDVLDSVKTYGL